LYAYGQDITAGKPDTLLTGSPKTFTLSPNVQNLTFEPITNEVINGGITNSEIDIIPGTEGQRIFPDAKQPDENISRKRVRVKAAISPIIAGTKVYFRNFDVDDPSSDSSIDDNGSDGNDNRDGRIIGQPYPATAAGTISASCTGTQGLPCAVTDSNGIATVDFTVTKQPGDNFVVSASTDESYLKGVAINGTGLKDSANKSLPTVQANRTKLLTVWRKLHMEIDSMGEVQGNFITGFLRTKGESVSRNSKFIDFHPSIGLVDEGSYRETLANDGTRLSYGGRMVIAGVNSLQVLGNSPIYLDQQMPGVLTPGGQRIQVQNLNEKFYLRPNHPFKLFDDDDFNSDDDQKDGDNGENVELLSDTLSHMQAKDNVDENAYAAAYIMPEYQWAEAQAQGFNNSNVPFELYSPCSLPDCDQQRTRINAQRGSQASERDNFWVGYLLVSYQGDQNSDADPNTVPSGFLGGIAPSQNINSRINRDFYDPNLGVPPGGIGAVIFIEGLRDYALAPFPIHIDPITQQIATFARTRTAPHEVGHQFGLGHNNFRDDGGIMSYTGGLYFTPNHINMLRWRVKSPGEGE
jgi:hypothetical protein